MKSDKLNLSIDMVISMAIRDFALQKKISEAESRNRIMSSNAVEVLYDPKSGLWAEGPDSFLNFYQQIG